MLLEYSNYNCWVATLQNCIRKLHHSTLLKTQNVFKMTNISGIGTTSTYLIFSGASIGLSTMKRLYHTEEMLGPYSLFLTQGTTGLFIDRYFNCLVNTKWLLQIPYTHLHALARTSCVLYSTYKNKGHPTILNKNVDI